jgi:hypothetical protein
LLEHSFEEGLEHRNVGVAERDRPQRLVGDVLGVDEVIELVGDHDAHADGQRVDERSRKRRFDDDLGAAASRDARCHGDRQRA